MSLWDSIFGTDDALAAGRELDAKRQYIADSYKPGGSAYERIQASRGDAAADKAAAAVAADYEANQADVLDAKGQAIYDADHESDSGLGKLLKDLFLLAAVGAAIWAFVNFGGAGAVKKLAGKAKWVPWALGGAAVLIVMFIYTRSKQTVADAGNLGSNFGKNIKAIFGF